METVGFVGLGHMGKPMAINLLKAGYKLNVFDINQDAVNELVFLGANAAKTLADVSKDADVFFTMLQTGDQVLTVCLDQDDLFASAKRGALYVDCSSIELEATKELHQQALIQGIHMVDAPVSGGTAAAEAATLTFMVGGKEEIFYRVQPFLEKMGRKVIYAGPAGSGQAAKICNNLILGISMVAVSEGFNLAQKLGLDPKKFFEISSNASGQCWSMTSYCPVPGVIEKCPANNDYKPGFMSKMMLKDLRLAQHAAESVNASIPLGAETSALYTLFVNQGNGDVDFSGIIKMLT